VLAATALTVALGAGACARASSAPGPIAHPTSADALVLKVETGGGFVGPLVSLRQFSTFALYGDGRLIVPGPQIEIYPGPALPNLQVQQVSEAGIQAILEAARRAGLLGPSRRYVDERVADAATTTFTLVADGARHVVSVYALAGSPGGPSRPQAVARLGAFLSRLSSLKSWLPHGSLGPETAYRATTLRVYAMPYQRVDDLTEPPVRWPSGTLGGFAPFPAFEGTRCGTVSGSELQAAIRAAARANELTPWVADGRRWTVVFRPLLPDESGCR